jgi:hypothetical protein
LRAVRGVRASQLQDIADQSDYHNFDDGEPSIGSQTFLTSFRRLSSDLARSAWRLRLHDWRQARMAIGLIFAGALLLIAGFIVFAFHRNELRADAEI